jgi:hypothetical protein
MTSSSSSSSKTPLDQYLTDNKIRHEAHDNDHSNPAYIVLLGNFTGDMMHCAAAQILFGYRVEGPNFPFPNWVPRTCISIMIPDKDRKYTEMTEKTREKWLARRETPAKIEARGLNQAAKQKGTVEKLERKSQSEGKKAYIFLRSLGLRCSLAPVRWITSVGIEISNRSLEYKTCKKFDDDQWKRSMSKTLPSSAQFDEEFEIFSSNVTIWTRRDSQGKEQPIKDKGPDAEDNLIHLLMSTSVVMQLMQYIGVEHSQIILGERLCAGLNDGQLKAADDKLKALKSTIEKAKEGQAVKKVLLFNYRLGEVNKQHDSCRSILEQVKKLARAKGLAVVIVPQMSKDQYEQHFIQVSKDEVVTPDYIFDIYDLANPKATKEDQYNDKRITAKFWTTVAQELQIHPEGSKIPTDGSGKATEKRCVIGLMGGRSGSMDLPGFVGVNCLSWDEPLITEPDRDPDWTRLPTTLTRPNEVACVAPYHQKAINVQVPQYLRLLNESPIMQVTYLSRYGVRTKEGKTGGNESSADNSLSDYTTEAETDIESDAFTVSKSSARSRKRKGQEVGAGIGAGAGAGAGVSSTGAVDPGTKKSRPSSKSNTTQLPTSAVGAGADSVGQVVTGKRKSRSRSRSSTSKLQTTAEGTGAGTSGDVVPDKKTRTRSKSKSRGDAIEMPNPGTVDRDTYPIYHYLEANRILDDWLEQAARSSSNSLPVASADFMVCLVTGSCIPPSRC